MLTTPIVALILLQLLALAALVALLLRHSSSAIEPVAPTEDPRLAQLLAADLPTKFTQLDTRAEGLNQHLRGELAQLRADSVNAGATLRTEVVQTLTTLSNTLNTALNNARTENEASAERLRSRVQEGLVRLNEDNAKELQKMRETVDEKLHTTLQTRLTESFGQVTDQLTKVHAGLGEMTKLSAGVDDLSRIFANVKSRGGFAEVQLGMLLQQMLAPGQFQQNVTVKPNTQEMVEYAVKFPTPNGDTLMPVDSKFNKDAWERLESAYSTGSAAEIAAAGKQFESAIRREARRICDKYICPPTTTSFAVMFLPTEGIYAEVMRRDGLQSDIQQNCRVTIAGPSTLSAILSSFQMGFHMLQMQEKGDEVWKVLAGAQKEFGNLGTLMTKMEKQVDTVQNTIREVGTRTRVINRTLQDVTADSTGALPPAIQTGFDGLLPMLAAAEDDDL